jgi:hypothetical protein
MRSIWVRDPEQVLGFRPYERSGDRRSRDRQALEGDRLRDRERTAEVVRTDEGEGAATV